MVEIALCLAIIGFALVAIIGVLPYGMATQRDNREETIINQDATIFIEAIRNGARGLDDLTNYVYAITNYQTLYDPNPHPTVTFGWTNGAPSILTNGANIVGLLSMPEFLNLNSNAITDANQLQTGNYLSNHIVAYVHSISGPAVEKPPQDPGGVIVADSFGYRILCVNAPATIAPPPAWVAQIYNPGDWVSYISVSGGQVTYWRAVQLLTNDVPGASPKWTQQTPIYVPQCANLHELRLTFMWPQLPNGNVGNSRQTFRTLVAGQIMQTNVSGSPWLYFYQSQSFTNAP
jgi:type II secretory pathway pseudopilin PulG